MGDLVFLWVQDVFYHSLAVVGVTANVITIVILCRGSCGLAGCTVRYLVSMAGADLLVIIFCVVLNQLVLFYFPYSVLLHYSVCALSSIVNAAAVDSSVWLTVAFTFDRFVAICCPRMKLRYCTEKTATRVVTTLCAVNYLRNIPRYFTYELARSPVPLGRVHVDGTVLTPLIPYVGILLLNALTVRHILVTSRARKSFRGTGGGGQQVDTEMENRKRSMVLLFTISGSFVILWIPRVVDFVYQEILLEMTPNLKVSQVGAMLMYLNSCSNTCIYALTQAKFREQVYELVTFPVCRLLKFLSDSVPKRGLRPRH
ncbi:probable G-protein coupled receptor 139 [Leucoraja erinacea]|uniref:probable G-protein coupled receptor 139 n=1 Tax=Leucoraja erinaceus TaxID=7782 RepID=UPI002454A625|nr:probable G-protein coupled receptor 139 [Leucoraja erinacea]